MAAYFFMEIETAFVDTSSCISEIVEVHSDILIHLLVALVVMFDAVAPRSAMEGLHVIVVLVGEATWAVIGSYGD